MREWVVIPELSATGAPVYVCNRDDPVPRSRVERHRSAGVRGVRQRVVETTHAAGMNSVPHDLPPGQEVPG